MRLFRDRFNVGSQRRSALAPGAAVISTLGGESTSARWFGMPVTEDDFAVGLRSIDVNATGCGEFFSLVVDREASPELVRAVHEAQIPGDAYLLRSGHSARSFRAFLSAAFALADAAPGALHEEPLRTELARALVASVRRPAGGRPIVPGNSFGARFQAVRSCEAYMRERIDESISLQDLSDFSGFRPRSLINAFEAFTGLSPMAYFKVQRLNGVRRRLLTTSRQQMRIIDIAMDWGFEHMGHFAADYRAMFGERPSDTERGAQSLRARAHASLSLLPDGGEERGMREALLELIRAEASA
jgi:AraC-like DNA-binding protein